MINEFMNKFTKNIVITDKAFKSTSWPMRGHFELNVHQDPDLEKTVVFC